MIGAVHLVPTRMFAGHNAVLGIDISGTNIRTGMMRFNLDNSPDPAKATKVWEPELWRHSEEKPSRDEAVNELVGILKRFITGARKTNLNLAPIIGIGCPGRIEADGSIKAGAQNLPGNWEGSRFNPPRSLREAIAGIGWHETVVVIHNDAVVQGLSEAPFMRDVSLWGIFTISTGLGNALFENCA
jgi:predicted NBD/HSP70 family sugar kinase